VTLVRGARRCARGDCRGPLGGSNDVTSP
jgi:hypothetical protein